jgi:hypothetical protein
MTTTAMLLMLSMPMQAEATPLPQLTMVQGQVAISHGSASIVAGRGAKIAPGSSVSTNAGARASIYWQPGLIVYLDEQTEIALTGTASEPEVHLRKGSIRTVASRPALVFTDHTASVVKRGVSNYSSSGSNTLISAVKGEIQSTNQIVQTNAVEPAASGRVDKASLTPGSSLTHTPIGGFAESQRNSINLRRPQFSLLRMQTIAQLSREQRGKTIPPPPLPMDRDDDKKTPSKDDKKDPAKDDKKDDKKPDKKPDRGQPPSTTDPNDPNRGFDNLLPPETNEPPVVARSGSKGEGGSAALGVTGINLSLGKVSLSTAAGGAGGLFTDANQATNAGMLQASIPSSVFPGGLTAGSPFPGNIFPVTTETIHSFNNVDLVFSDAFPLFREYWSVGNGALPTTQITTGINTGTNVTPTAIQIPQFPNYLVRLDQFGIQDPVTAQPGDSVSIAGLVGANPVNPNIQGATVSPDLRADINGNLTFALGEFAVDRDGSRPQLVVRRSDQDRRIEKDSGGNDANDKVTVNTDIVAFQDVADPLFFPTNPLVKAPLPNEDLNGNGILDGGEDLNGNGTLETVLTNRPSFGNLNFLRKAAATTLMADQLFEYSNRSGQTRFVVDGKILDISGYKR